MKLCILDNDALDPAVVLTYIGYGAMFERLLRQAGAVGTFDIFNTVEGHYPASFEPYDAVLLTGSKATRRMCRHVHRGGLMRILSVAKHVVALPGGSGPVRESSGVRLGGDH